MSGGRRPPYWLLSTTAKQHNRHIGNGRYKPKKSFLTREEAEQYMVDRLWFDIEKRHLNVYECKFGPRKHYHIGARAKWAVEQEGALSSQSLSRALASG